MLVNLLGNAVKFTEQGAVTLKVSLEANADEQYIRFEISDTGIGIDKEACNRLFVPFSQADSSTSRHYGGSGLGLSICKGLVGLMNGEIGVDSEPGVGSQFWFMIPYTASTVDCLEDEKQNS